MSSEHLDGRVEIHDSCAHCTARIRLTITDGDITTIDPPEALVFRGGG